MADNKGHLLPVYVVADESFSMKSYAGELNSGMVSLYEILRAEPMVAAKVRLTVLGFSDKVHVRLPMSDVRNGQGMPQVRIQGGTNYHAVFQDLLGRIPQDIATLKANGYQVHRPAVFFLSDGQPSGSKWRNSHNRLVDRNLTPAGPNIIACGIGEEVKAETILQVATHQDFAFVSIRGADLGLAIAEFFIALTSSVIKSGRSLTSANPELVVDKPEGFRLAIDVI